MNLQKSFQNIPFPSAILCCISTQTLSPATDVSRWSGVQPWRICVVSASASVTLLGPVSLWIRCMHASAGPLSCSRRNYTARLLAWKISPACLSYYPPFPPWQHPAYCHSGLFVTAKPAHNTIFRWYFDCVSPTASSVSPTCPFSLTFILRLWLLWLCGLFCSCDTSGLNQRLHRLPSEVADNTANTPRSKLLNIPIK